MNDLIKQKDWEKKLQDIFNELELSEKESINFSEGYIKTYQLFQQIHQKAVEEIIEEIREKIQGYYNNSEARSSDYQCQQEGYEYGLEDALTILSNLSLKEKKE